MSAHTHLLQPISGKDHGRRLRRSHRHCQHWRQNNHQSLLCWWHRLSRHRLSRRRRRTGKISWASWQSLHSVWHGNQCWEDQVDDNPVASTRRSKWTDRSLRQSQTSSTWAQLYLTRVPSLRYPRIAQTTAALTRLKPVWNDRSISLSSKLWLMRALVTSIFLRACESWTLTAELQRRIQAIKMRCYCKISHISSHLIHRSCYQRGSLCQDPAGNLTTWRPDHRKETQTEVVCTCLLFWPKPSYKEQWKGEEDKADRKRDGKTTSRNGKAWSLPSPRGQWRTEKNGGSWFWNHLWCPNDPCG